MRSSLTLLAALTEAALSGCRAALRREMEAWACESVGRLLGGRFDSATQLAGGLINWVFRVRDEGGESVVLKVTPPFIATKPGIKFECSRHEHEVLVLDLLCVHQDEPMSELQRCKARFPGLALPCKLASGPLRIPAELVGVEGHDGAIEVMGLVMTDLGEVPSLASCLVGGLAERPRVLGAFLGALHSIPVSGLDEDVQLRLTNQPVRDLRRSLQYDTVSDRLVALASEAVSEAALLRELGERLQRGEGSSSVIMGDLWPPSVLIMPPEGGDPRVGLIDWEFSDVGVPGQDVGHLFAHLWMHHHHLSQTGDASEVLSVTRAFLEAWASEFHAITQPVVRDILVHAAAEILARTVGSFVEGYLYAGLGQEHPLVREALGFALSLLGEAGSASASSHPWISMFHDVIVVLES
jgi:hypothetical protein